MHEGRPELSGRPSFSLDDYILAFTNPEHLGPTVRAYTLGCRFAIFHRNCFRVLNLSLRPALHTISFHYSTSLFSLILIRKNITINTHFVKH